MKVTWRLDSHYHIEPMTGELDLDEMSTTEEIETAVREDMWNYLDLTWECEEMELTEQDIADRMSNALNEIGEASAALVFAEREACAKLLDELVNQLVVATNDFTNIGCSVHMARADELKRAAILIRNRPR